MTTRERLIQILDEDYKKWAAGVGNCRGLREVFRAPPVVTSWLREREKAGRKRKGAAK